MGTRKARPNVQRTAGVDAYDRMQAWGWELAAKLDARGPVAKSAARVAADQCNSAGKAREIALRLARAGDADCATWQSRARELQSRNSPYQYATAAFSDESLRAECREALVTGAAYPRGFRSPRDFAAALYAAGEALERARDAANHAGRLEREWSPRVKESLESRQADTRKAAAVVGQAARWMIRLCAMAREQSPGFQGCRLRWQPILAKPLTLAQIEEHAVGFWCAYDPATAPAESADLGDTPAEEATAAPAPTVDLPDVAPTVAAVSAAVAELVPVRTSTTTRGGTSAAIRRIRQGLTPQEHDRMRQEHRASAAALPSATPPPTPPAKSTGAVRKSRETPEQRDARIAAWREQNAEERERRRLAAAAEREQRREDWRRAHARPALRIVRSA